MMIQAGTTPVPGYRIEAFLGRGNFGEVWLAAAPGGAKAALKFLNLREQHGRKEFRAIQRLKLIRHANLLPINAMWLLDANGEVLPDESTTISTLMEDTVRRTMMHGPVELKPAMLVIAMPLADKSLMDVLKERTQDGTGGIAPKELLSYMMDAAKAIDYLNAPRHDLGSGPTAIQHGDIKPDNLMLVGGAIQVCDFGVARALGPHVNSRGTTIGGSLAYMAPECLKGSPAKTSDQFSLAITYAELRKGKLPFDESSAAKVIEDRNKGRFELDEFSPPERAVLKRALHPDPDRRFASNVEMVEALQNAFAGNVPKPTPWLSIAATGLVAAIATIVVLFTLQWSFDRSGVDNDFKIQQETQRIVDRIQSETFGKFPLNDEQIRSLENDWRSAVDRKWMPDFSKAIVDVTSGLQGPEQLWQLSDNGDWLVRAAPDLKSFEIVTADSIVANTALDTSKPPSAPMRFDLPASSSLKRISWLSDRYVIAELNNGNSHSIQLFRLDLGDAPKLTAAPKPIPFERMISDWILPSTGEYFVVKRLIDGHDNGIEVYHTESWFDASASSTPPIPISNQRLGKGVSWNSIQAFSMATEQRKLVVLRASDDLEENTNASQTELHILDIDTPELDEKHVLAIEVPTFAPDERYRRQVHLRPVDGNKSIVSIFGVDVDQSPESFLYLLDTSKKLFPLDEMREFNSARAVALATRPKRDNHAAQMAILYKDGTLCVWEPLSDSFERWKIVADRLTEYDYFNSLNRDYKPSLAYNQRDDDLLAMTYFTGNQGYVVDVWWNRGKEFKPHRLFETDDVIKQAAFATHILLVLSDDVPWKGFDLGFIQFLLQQSTLEGAPETIIPVHSQPAEATIQS